MGSCAILGIRTELALQLFRYPSAILVAQVLALAAVIVLSLRSAVRILRAAFGGANTVMLLRNCLRSSRVARDISIVACLVGLWPSALWIVFDVGLGAKAEAILCRVFGPIWFGLILLLVGTGQHWFLHCAGIARAARSTQ